MLTTPFTVLEEAVYHIERKHTPWNVQIEVETSADIDPDRLDKAVVEACNKHPLMRARRRENGGLDTEYVWEIPEEVGAVPVEVAHVDDGDDLARLRTRFYGGRFDLTKGAPFSLMVAREDEVDRLMFSVSHVPCDGVGSLRFVRSVCDAYRGKELGDEAVGFEKARRVLDDVRPSSITERMEQIGNAASHLGNTFDRPDRISEDGGSEERGWGFVHRSLDCMTDRIVDNRPDGVSVNDVLLACLHTTIEDWNAEHDDESDKISLMMPVNLRPEGWFYDVVGMYALFQSVETRWTDRGSPEAVMREVSKQTTEIKERDRAVSFLESLHLIPPETPVGLRGQLPELLKGPGRGMVDTAVLSNLGRVPDPPALEDGGPQEVWFSPPSQSPTELGVGVVTAGGSINLVFRHTFSVFDREAARRFADSYVENLSGFV